MISGAVQNNVKCLFSKLYMKTLPAISSFSLLIDKGLVIKSVFFYILRRDDEELSLHAKSGL